MLIIEYRIINLITYKNENYVKNISMIIYWKVQCQHISYIAMFGAPENPEA